MRFRQFESTLIVDAPAKLNLSLEILGRRPDGFHELETVMVSVGLFDTLRFDPAPEDLLELRCDQSAAGAGPRDARSRDLPLLSTGGDNLIVRAAKLLKDETGSRQGVRIHLTKRIPMQAGMGGGSSDAAAALAGLNRFWKLGLDFPALHRLAARLGSDVNFFLDSPPAALCRGRGELIEPRPLRRPLDFVIVKPPAGLSTAEVFREWRQDESRTRTPATAEELLQALQGTNPLEAGRMLWNALEPPARRLSSEVARALQVLASSGGPAILMTGSGTACFALCRNRSHAIAVAGRVRQRNVGQVVAVRTAT